MVHNAGFCTVINCMDGRVQIPVIEYLKKHFKVPYVDSITEPGPVKIIADNANPALLQSIQNRLNISIEKHKSIGIAIVAHVDCAGNPAPPDIQKEQLSRATNWLRAQYPALHILAIWLDDQWQIHLCE